MGALRRRPQFAGEPAARVRRGHGVAGYHCGFNATAFLALECTAVEAGGSGLELRPAACDSGRTSGSGAARWQTRARTIPADTRASDILR